MYQTLITEYTGSYLSVHTVLCTPCAVNMKGFFNMFSVDMWICVTLSLVLAVSTVSCISDYRHKSHLHHSNSYNTIFSVIINQFYGEELTPVRITKRTTYMIDKLLDKWYRRGILEYIVRWKGCWVRRIIIHSTGHATVNMSSSVAAKQLQFHDVCSEETV
jgi:hypothetical protein